MKIKRFFNLFFSILFVLALTSCVKEEQKVKTIAIPIDTFEKYTITNFLGVNVDIELSNEEVLSIQEGINAFYEYQYFIADVTRTPLVKLSVINNFDKMDFVCALDDNSNRCYMIYVNSVSYYVKVDDEFTENHNFFSTLYSIAEHNYLNTI